MKYIVLFILCVFVSSCSQILLKKAALQGNIGIKTFLNKKVVLGYGIFFVVTVLVTQLYKYIDLSLGTLLDSFGYIFVIGLSVIFLKEKISVRKLIGMFLITIGVIFGMIV